MFSKKKEKKFNPYENRADEMLYKVWEERDRLSISYECADDLLEKLKE